MARAVEARIDAGPVNRSLAVASATAGIAWWLWPGPDTPWQQDLIAWMSAACAASSALQGVRLLAKDFVLRRDLARSKAATSDHGSAREATYDELLAAGMTDPASGNLLGLYHGAPIFEPPSAPFRFVEGPPGASKTTRYLIGAVIHAAFSGKSVIVPDVKGELAPMLGPALKKLGFKVWCINPAKKFIALCGDVEINLYESVLAAVYSESDLRLDAIKRASDLAAVHLPDGDDAEAKNSSYFRAGARRCIALVVLYLAITEPARCTPTDVFALLNDAGTFIKKLKVIRSGFETWIANDPIVAFLKTEAAGILYLAKENGENLSSFVQWATQTLITYNQGGRLAGYGRTAAHSLAEVRREQHIVFIMTPLSHMRDFAPLIAMVNYNLIAAAKDDPTGHPIYLAADEALNYRINDLVSDLEALRALRVTATFVLQSFSGLQRVYGRDAAAAIDSYASVKVFVGISSYERAKHISDMLSEATIRTQSYSYRNVATDLGVTSAERSKRLMTPDEILSMPRDRAWVFATGLRPFRVKLVHYGNVAPWRDLVGDNPIEGGKLRGKVLVDLDYPKRDAP